VISTNNIWKHSQRRTTGRPRHALGAWLPTAKLASRGFMPSLRDRKQMVGRRPFWFTFGGINGDVAIGANQTVELRHICQSDFICYAILASATTSSQAQPGFRAQIADLSTMPGKGKKFSAMPINNVNFGGSAQHPFILRKPYRFCQGRTIVVKITNLRNVTNNCQVVLVGVIDE